MNFPKTIQRRGDLYSDYLATVYFCRKYMNAKANDVSKKAKNAIGNYVSSKVYSLVANK
jgi:hypothetical protein